MRKILEDFFNGNIIPYDKSISANSELMRKLECVASREEQLLKTLNEEERKLLDKLTETQRSIDGITAMENFILGFRLGVRLMAECMDEDDGSLIDER